MQDLHEDRNKMGPYPEGAGACTSMEEGKRKESPTLNRGVRGEDPGSATRGQ